MFQKEEDGIAIENLESGSCNINATVIKAIGSVDEMYHYNYKAIETRGNDIIIEGCDIISNYYGIYVDSSNQSTITINNSKINCFAKHYYDGSVSPSQLNRLYGIYSLSDATINLNNTEMVNKSTYMYNEINYNYVHGNSYGIYNGNNGTINVSGTSKFDICYSSGSKSVGIYNELGNVNLKSGDIEMSLSSSTAYGIYNVKGIITIGEKSGETSTINPVITGSVGILNNDFLIFYDGAIRGKKEETVEGKINEIEENKELVTNVYDNYYETILTEKTAIAKVNEQEYLTIQEAIDACAENTEEPEVIEILRSAILTEADTCIIPSNKNIKINLQEYDIDIPAGVDNSGKLEIVSGIEKEVTLGESWTNKEDYYFEKNSDGVLIPTNGGVQGLHNTTANSYIELNLEQFTEDVTITVNASISSESGCDIGFATMNQSTTFPSYSSTTGRFIYISGTSTAKDYTTTISGGQTYYLHLGYRKDGSADTGEDLFKIYDIQINEESIFNSSVTVIVPFYGSILSSAQNLIKNNENAELKINKATLNSTTSTDNQYIIYNLGNKLDIIDSDLSIYTSQNKSFTNIGCIYNENGNVDIENTTIRNTSLYISSSSYSISDSFGINNNLGTINLSNVKIDTQNQYRYSKNNYGIKNISGNINCVDSNIIAQKYSHYPNGGNYGIYNESGEIFNTNVKVNSTVLLYNTNATYNYGIYNSSGTIKLIEGEIDATSSESTYVKHYGIYNSLGTIELGDKDNTAIEIPEISSFNIGICNTGIFNFYDGVIKGKKTAILGDYTEVEEEYTIQIEIENSYEKAYLGAKSAVASVNGAEYNTIQEAVIACGDTDYSLEIDILKGYRLDKNDYINIGENQNIIIDLNGFTIVDDKEIVNNGNLQFMDSSENQTGNLRLFIREDRDICITNNGTLKLNIQNLYIYSESSLENVKGIYNDNNGIIEIHQGTYEFEGKRQYFGNNLIYNNSGGIKIIDGTMQITEYYGEGKNTTKYSKLIYNNDRIEILGGEFLSASYYMYNIYNDSNAQMSITGGIFKPSNDSNNMIIYNLGVIDTIENVTITSRMNSNIYNTGKITINSGTFQTTYSGYNCISNSAGEVIINGGEFTYGQLYNTEGGKLTITGGTVSNTSGYGIYNYQSSNSTTDVSTVTIGKQDTIVNTNYPQITGSTYGIYNGKSNSSYPEPIFNFYDGSITGGTASIFGEPTEIEPNYEIQKTWKDNKETATLSVTNTLNAAVRIGSVNYDTIEDALGACTADKETTLVLLNMVTATEGSITIPSGYSVKIDLNGWGIRNTQIINNGTLTIVDSSIEACGVIICETGTAIVNNGTLNLGTDDGNIQAVPIIKAETAIENNGTLNYYDGKIMGTTNIITGTGTKQIPSGATETEGEEDTYKVLTLN